MKVILKQDVKGLGKGGDLIEVKDGYARNYLIPQGLVASATSKNIKAIEHAQKQIANRIKQERAGAEDLAARLKNVSITIAKRVGENNRLFGSVTNKELAEALREEGLLVDRRFIELEENIKELGVFEVPVRLHQDVTTTVKVWVVAK